MHATDGRPESQPLFLLQRSVQAGGNMEAAIENNPRRHRSVVAKFPVDQEAQTQGVYFLQEK